LCSEHADREAAGGTLLSAEPRVEGAGGMLGRDGGDGTRFGRRKYVLFITYTHVGYLLYLVI